MFVVRGTRRGKWYRSEGAGFTEDLGQAELYKTKDPQLYLFYDENWVDLIQLALTNPELIPQIAELRAKNEPP